MKKAKQKQNLEKSDTEPDISRKTREKYHKEIVQNKESKKNKINIKQNGDGMISKQEENGDDSKFSELKKYLLTDLRTEGVKNSSPIKSVPVLEESRSSNHTTMLDTRTELNQDALKSSSSSVKNKSAEKLEKSSSPAKKLSNRAANSKESPNLDNKTQLSPSKKPTLSPEKLSPGSQRVGSRQRSPNLRYADDMVLFPPKRQLFKKENNIETTNNNEITSSESSLSSECQTSQLYSLLTGTVVNAQKHESPKNIKTCTSVTATEKKRVGNAKNAVKDKDLKCSLKIDKSQDQSSDVAENLKSVAGILTSGVLNKDFTEKAKEIDTTVKMKEMDNIGNSKSSGKAEPVSTPGALEHLSNVIDQIIVESLQEEIPEWAVYKAKAPKVRKQKRRKSIAQALELKIDPSASESTVLGDVTSNADDTVKRIELASTPASSGDEDDLKGKRRITKPISKRSLIRMSPALGLLVGHDEDGFTIFDESKKAGESGEENDKEKAEKSPETKKDAVQFPLKITKEPQKSVITSDKLTVSSPNTSALKLDNSIYSQITLLGHNAGIPYTKATIVSGTQSVPCVLVPKTSSLKPTFITVPASTGCATSGSNILIPANRISLIGTAGKPLTSSVATTSVRPSLISLNVVPGAKSNARPTLGTPIQVVNSAGQPISLLKSPNISPGQALFRLSNDGKSLIPSATPNVRVPKTTVTASHVTSTVTSAGCSMVNAGQTTTKVSNTVNVASPVNLPPKSKVLILKKSNIPTSSGPILVSSPSKVSTGKSPGVSLLKKIPTTVTSSSDIVSSESKSTTSVEEGPKLSVAESDNSFIGIVKKKLVEEQKKLLPLNNLISKVKTNMNSLMPLPEILKVNMFMDSVMINEEYENDGEDNEEMLEQPKGQASDTENFEDRSCTNMASTGQKAENLESDLKQRVTPSEFEEKKEPVISDDMFSDVKDIQMMTDENTEQGDEKDTEISKDESLTEKLEKVIVECITNTQESLIEKNKNTDVIEQNNELESDVTELKEEEKSEAIDPVRESPSSALQSKLKKAMESLSNVKSVLAAKADASKHNKIDQKIDSQKVIDVEQNFGEITSDKNETQLEKGICGKIEAKMSDKDILDKNEIPKLDKSLIEKNVIQKQDKTDTSYLENLEEENQLKKKDYESVSGNGSDFEDHGHDGKRRNIFDVIMSDYQSPSKEEKSGTLCNSGEQNIIEVQDSPIKTSQDSICKIAASTSPARVPADRSLFDIGLGAQSKTDTDQVVKEQKENDIEVKTSADRRLQDGFRSLRDDELPQVDNEIHEIDNEITENNEDVFEVDEASSNRDVNTPDGSSKFENEEDGDEFSIFKVQQSGERDSLEMLTMADKLLAKFTECEENEESGRKTPVSKPPIKLKICSSPDKSYVISSAGISRPDKSMRSVNGRQVPRNSTQREIKEPLPMDILSKPEQENTDKLSAFSSQVLDNFLENQAIEIMDEEEEEDDDDENANDSDSDVSMNEHEADFDEIDGILFMSFPSKNALQAHVKVERRTKLGTDENLLLGMTRMRNMRRKQGYILSKYNKKVGNKFFKNQDNISQNLRGMHKTLAKYQRLYKQELNWLENPEQGSSTLCKTNDITKIKGWKNKVEKVTHDVEHAKAQIENEGKLHWRTEARLAKNLKPDELKEFGLNIKKKRRKNIIYTQRKGMSKGDRSQKAENGQEEIKNEDSRSNSNDIQFVDEEQEIKEVHQEEQAGEKADEIIFHSDDEVQDEELVRIKVRELMKENEKEKLAERQRMFFKAQNLKKRLSYSLRDIQVIRKLGGHNIRRRRNVDGEEEGDYIVMDNNPTSRPSTPDIEEEEEKEKETPTKKARKSKVEMAVTVLSSNMVIAACTAVPKDYLRKNPPVKKPTETSPRSPESEQGQSTSCDKPGCRYGCICHLCMFTEQSPEADSKVVKCEKEYCRLGCICDSIGVQKERELNNAHCGMPSCMVECFCEFLDPEENTKINKKDEDDYKCTGQKKNSKFAALPRRESTYRLAKNLDAVSRKAMLYYESSEMFVDQKKKRRKSKDTPETATQRQYIDSVIDLDDIDSGPSKSKKLDSTAQKSTLSTSASFKPKPQQYVEKKKEMTDFSNIKSEISSQGSWNLSDLSDEYEDIDAGSDEDLQYSTCARTTYYKAVKRDKHLSSYICSCGKKDHCDVNCNTDDGKFNIPEDILSSGKWHTQWICLRSKGQSLESADIGGLRLLEVISNCNYEETKAKILSRLTSFMSRDSYPKLKSFVVGEFKVSFLPKSDKPAVIPPEVQAKLPQSVYSIRIQIVKDSGTASQVIDLDEQDDVVCLTQDELSKQTQKQSGKLPKHTDKPSKGQISVNAVSNSGIQLTVTNDIQKQAGQAHPVVTTESQVTPTNMMSIGGISGFSHLQISRPTGPIGFVPIVPTSSTSVTNKITPIVPLVSQIGPSQLVLVPDKVLGKTVGVRSDAITTTQPINVLASYANTVTTSANTLGKIKTFPAYVMTGKPVSTSSTLPGMIQGQEHITTPYMGTSNNNIDSQNLKRKLPDKTLTVDPKKSKIDNGMPQGLSSVTTGNFIKPISNISEDIGQVSVLKCIKCNVILTADDITNWVLSQDSIQEKICVKCRGSQNKNVNILQRIPPRKTSPIIIDSPQKTSLQQNVKDGQGQDLVKQVESETNKMRNIVQEIDPLILNCDDGNKSSDIKANEDRNEIKSVIDLSSDNEGKTKTSKSDDSTKRNTDANSVQSENEEDELEAAIRDAQDDYDDMARNLSDNESPSEDYQKGSLSTKSKVIVIDDDEDASDPPIKPKDESGSSDDCQPQGIKRSWEDDEDVDILGYSENDPADKILISETGSSESAWHSSSCSLHNNLLRKKRKAQLDLIENKQINQVEIRESLIKLDSQEYRKYRLNKERNRRGELQAHYKSLADLVMSEEDIPMNKISKLSPVCNILDKTLEYIRTEVPKMSELEKKVGAFKLYQRKLMKRLEELKAYHTQRGISKEKLDFQLEKIAVVCDKIYDHLPEIKKHIKSKKGGQESVASQKSVKTKPKKQHKPKGIKTSAEIYIDNPEEYDNEGGVTQSATPLSSLPGSYSNSVAGKMLQRPVLCMPSSTMQTSTPVNLQGTNVFPAPLSNIRLQHSNTAGYNSQNVHFPLPITSAVQLQGPVNVGSVAAEKLITVPNVTPLTAGSVNGSLPILQVPNPALQTPQINMIQVPVQSVVVSSTSAIAPHFSSVQNKGLAQETSTLRTILSAPPSIIDQNLGQHSSTSAFSDVLGEMIRNNVQNSSLNETNKKQMSENSVPPIPQYDVNLLKDKILDDATGELIAVVMNEEDNENDSEESNISSKSMEDSCTSSKDKDNSDTVSKNNENLLKDQILDDATGELIAVVMNEEDNENDSEESNISSKSTEGSSTSSKGKDNSDTVSKSMENTKEISDSKQISVDSIEINENILEKDENSEEEAPNIESLLDDIKSLSQETESPTKSEQVHIENPSILNDNILTGTNEQEDSVVNDNKMDQVDGDMYSFSTNKDGGNISESDSNNSARTNVYMEDSDGNVSIAGDIDELGDVRPSTPKIVSVMSISDVLGDNFKSIDESSGTGPEDDVLIPTSSVSSHIINEDL